MHPFKIAAAQVPSDLGDIAHNLATHVQAIEAAAKQAVSMLVFPELSLTGYEIDLAANLALAPDDFRLEPLRELARSHQMEVVVGAPLQSSLDKPYLGAIVFGADGGTKTYRKMHLGGDEPHYFLPGEQPLTVSLKGQKVGVAICADASQATHPQVYAAAGVGVYAASVFLSPQWYLDDAPRLASYAERFRLLVVMANHADSRGTYASVGKSAVWAPDGSLLAQAAGSEKTLVIATQTDIGWSGEVASLANFSGGG